MIKSGTIGLAFGFIQSQDTVGHRIRIYTEEIAKVVAASSGTELLKFLDSQAILTRMSRRIGLFAPGRVEE